MKLTSCRAKMIENSTKFRFLSILSGQDRVRVNETDKVRWNHVHLHEYFINIAICALHCTALAVVFFSFLLHICIHAFANISTITLHRAADNDQEHGSRIAVHCRSQRCVIFPRITSPIFYSPKIAGDIFSKPLTTQAELTRPRKPRILIQYRCFPWAWLTFTHLKTPWYLLTHTCVYTHVHRHRHELRLVTH